MDAAHSVKTAAKGRGSEFLKGSAGSGSRSIGLDPVISKLLTNQIAIANQDAITLQPLPFGPRITVGKQTTG